MWWKLTRTCASPSSLARAALFPPDSTSIPDPSSPSPHNGSPDQWRSHLQELIDTFMKVWNLPKPVIAAVNGYALGGACELVQVCDVKIASDRAMLGEPEIRAGFGPPLLITPYSVNLAAAKELLLTGDSVDAYEAARIGLVSRVVPHDQLMEECERVARKMCLISQLGVKMTKVAVNRALENMGFLNSVSQNPRADDHLRHQRQPRAGRVQRRRRRTRTAGGPSTGETPALRNWTKKVFDKSPPPQGEG